MTWLYSSTFLPYTVVSFTSEAAGYEAAKLPVLDNHPYLRSWRSGGGSPLAAQSLLFDVGAPIVDPGFELGNLATAWSTLVGTAGGGDTATADGAIKRTGSFSMKIVCASGNDFGRQQTVNVQPGIQYTLRGAIRVTARAAGTIHLDVYYLPSGPTTSAIILSATTGGVFNLYTDLATIPAGCTQVAIRCYGTGTPKFTAYFDDLSLTPKIGAIAVFNTNVPALTIGHKYNDEVSFAFLTGSPFTINKHWDFYRTCLVQTVPLDREFITVQMSGGITNNSAGYYQIGSIQFTPPLTAFPRAPAKNMQETLVGEYEKSGESVAAAGPLRIRQEWQMVATATQVQRMQDFVLISQANPFLVYENNGVPSQCYLMRYTDNIQFTRSGVPGHVITNPRTLELI